MISKKVKISEVLLPRFFGGDGGVRTLDLCVANAALYQLSYAPERNYYITSRVHSQELFSDRPHFLVSN